MRNKLFTLAALAAVFAISPAFAETSPSTSTDTSYKAKDNGGYVAKEKAVSTDSSGTTVDHMATKKVEVDNNGNKTTVVDVKDSTDPKGMFNKTTNETENKAVEKNGDTKMTHKKMVNGKTVEDKTETSQPQ